LITPAIWRQSPATPLQLYNPLPVSGIDAVTGATITSEAIITAAARALAGGAK